MASLKKRGRYYYIKFFRIHEDGSHEESVKSLGIRYKDMAEKALETLERLEQNGEINPYSPRFDPQKVLEDLK
ncbi:MAG TPA: hypothetical protein VLA13_09425, partial [Massilibacterium sp.]|nr:hypothetical protein [Massilibacterium sp.]